MEKRELVIVAVIVGLVVGGTALLVVLWILTENPSFMALFK